MTKTTELLYLKDSYKKEEGALITSIKSSGKNTLITLNQTIFYPQGGGQPSDKGEIEGENGRLSVKHVSYNNGVPIHQGILTGNLKADEKVIIKIDWNRRYLNMQQHTAGHILDEAVKEIMPEFPGIEGSHGISKQYFIKFKGVLDSLEKKSIEKIINRIIEDNEKISTRMITKKQIEKENIFLPFELPTNKPLRLLQIGSRMPIPDGGTQLKTTKESWPINIEDFEYEEGHTIIHYKLKLNNILSEKIPISTKSSLQEIRDVRDEIIKQAINEKVWNSQIYTKYLGKKGLFNTKLSKKMSIIPAKQKSEAGKILNQTKAELIKLSTKVKGLENDTEWIDVTAPGILPPEGHIHPISQAIQEIQSIFESIGFTRVRYPEVDYDKYVFENLNMPADHPARDEWETFFIDAPKHKSNGRIVLTPHTSNSQTREMERVGNPPIRMLNIAKCYRRQQDVTHTAMFHQFEGLVIDERINIQHLKGTLDYFAKKFYGPAAKSRIRPFMFKFTEPSFEVDFSCTHCKGTGKQGSEKCRFCKAGWHEVGGAGMVHPNVLKTGGIDPNKYTGFAFGWGVERVYTLKPGLELDDIRPFYSTNLEFLRQF